MLQVLGTGLSRTGTTSLSRALSILGFQTLHYAPERLSDIVIGQNQFPNFRRYDDVDAVTDIPAAYFWRELLVAYPNLRIILTERDIEKWYESISHHYGGIIVSEMTQKLQALVYGSSTVTSYLWKKRYIDHNDCIKKLVPADRLLVMNIPGGDGWEKLCQFLEKPIPAVPFPCLNRGKLKCPPWMI
jgi:hypothetical protein